MSLYNLMHGVNDQTPLLKAMLCLDLDGGTPTGRFRDIHLNEDGTKIILFTRNGGGNREHWSFSYETEEGEDCPCPGCIQSYVLPKHPNYIRDWDDDFDCTFAHTEFLVPAEFLPITTKLATGEAPVSLEEKTMAACAEMSSMTAEQLREDSRFAPLVNVLDEITKNSEQKS